MDFAIIAAGEGSRLVQEGCKKPKPLVEVAGRPLVDRLIDIFLRNGASSVNIIINEEMKDVAGHLSGIKCGVPFNIVIRSTPSSMHSLYELRTFLNRDKFCLTTVDTVFDELEFSEFIRSFGEDCKYDGVMAVTDFIDDEKPLYVKTDADMLIEDFLDRDDHPFYVSGGIYCLCPDTFQTLEKCVAKGVSRMRNFQRELLKDGFVLKAFPFRKILDVDHMEDIKKAEDFLLS